MCQFPSLDQSKLPASDHADDADACFADLKRHLDLPNAQETIPLDKLFEEAFNACFNVHPRSLSSEARSAFFNALDRNQNGRISLVEWRLFYQEWRESGNSMADYAVLLLPPGTPTSSESMAQTAAIVSENMAQTAASSSETAASIIDVVKKAYDTALEVKANKRRCRRLGERLHALIGPLGNLQDDARATDKEIALEQMLVVVREAESLIEKYQQAKWYERTVGAACETLKGDFEDINERLRVCVEAPQFGIITETMFAVSDDRDDELKDLFEIHATLEAMLAVQGRPPQDVAAMEDELSAVDARLQQLGENISEKLCRLGADEEGRADIIAAVKEGLADIKEGQADMIARLEAIEAHIGRFRGRRRGVEAGDARSHREQQHTLREIKRRELIETDVILGKGTFGVVRAATWGACHVALKHLDILKSDFAASALEDLKEEAILHQSLSHPNILAFYGFCPGNVSLVIERSFGGNLAARLYAKPTRPLSSALVLAYLSDVLEGLAYLHNLGVFHRDLKSRKLFICVGGVVKLADFGLAKVREATSTWRIATGQTRSSPGKGPGTYEWMAPELLDGSKNPPWREADVYALGVVCYELCTCSPPWADKIDAQIIAAVVSRKQRPEIPASARAANPVVVELLEKFWAHDPNARPVLADGWVQRRVASALEALGGDPRKFHAVLEACSPESKADTQMDSDVLGDETPGLGKGSTTLAFGWKAVSTILAVGRKAVSASFFGGESIDVVVSNLGHEKDDGARTLAAEQIALLCQKDISNAGVLRELGAIPLLIELGMSGSDWAKRQVARALMELASNDENQIAIAKAGAIPVLVELAKDGTDGAKEGAAGALWNLAFNNDENKIAIAKAGAIPVLTKLAKDGTDGAKKQAAGALGNLAFNNAENQIAIAKAGAIPVLTKLAKDGTDGAKKQAAGALGNLAFNNDENKIAIAKAGAIPVLTELAKDGTDGAKEGAVGALWNLAVNGENQIAIAKAGAIPVLTELAKDGTDGAKKQAAGALGNLAFNNDENKIAIAKAGAIPVLTKLAKDGTDGAKEGAAGALRNLASNDENKIAIAKAGAIPVLVELAKDGTDGAKERAAGALGNLAFNNDENQIAIAKAGAIPVLVELAKDGTDGAKEGAAGALWNLAFNNDENQIAIAKAGAIPVLTKLAKDGTDGAKKQAAAALGNLAVNDENRIAIAKAGAIPVLTKLAKDGTDGAKEGAAGALRNLASNDENKIAIAKAGAIPVLVELAKDGTDGAKEGAAAALGNLAVNNDENQIAIAKAGAIPVLVELAEGGNDDAKEGAAAALWNLAVNAENKIAIAKAGAIPLLVKLAREGRDVAKERAAGALGNLAFINAENQIAIAKAGAIPVLVQLAEDCTDRATKRSSTGGLLQVAVNADDEIARAKAEAIPVLFKVVEDVNEGARMMAAGALWNLAVNDENKIAIKRAGGVGILEKVKRSGSEGARHNAAGALDLLR
ncbi:hypothetical protein CTAYLR_004470 [Chrysophaeum taylorii]|uniref:Protein kinase domain-containing protein n=1 Tax=Chrysophaeum taylorii TaxID=2483200 RepID=A0AAD7XRQ5_9STRA|nr:hypothetical protein CTAYLR_004418 [Chrysophaeum taylorii]KAJ8613626.1 hypothetical protein CTAYLR_004470 [Chrysophaeum taylorii]